MMPMMLSWVLGGNSSKLEGRPVCCRLSDKANDQLHTWFVEDDALERTINGEKKITRAFQLQNPYLRSLRCMLNFTIRTVHFS
ncbi:hypothetical protein AAHE18_06G048000 [Arachis hypogaea]